MTTQDSLWYRTDELHKVPVEPGLYAWYAVPSAGVRDWRVDRDAHGHDRGGRNFARFLAWHTRTLQRRDLGIAARGRFWTRWRGSLNDTGTEILARHLESLSASRPNGPGADLVWALQHEARREVLAQILLKTSPGLSPPVYIGVAENLRKRIGTHISDLEKAMKQHRNRGSSSTSAHNNFGQRAIDSGLTLADLRVSVLPIRSAAELHSNQYRRVAQAAEFVLNRWYHPQFGER